MPSKNRKIDLEFRPDGYFGMLTPEGFVLSNIKGTKRRTAIKAAISANDLEAVPDQMLQSEVPQEMRDELASIHPSFLGGEFLAPRSSDEIEIARVTIESVTCDVTSVYVRYRKGRYRYRIVDEYEGETISGPSKLTSERPLSLGELITFLDAAWPLMPVLEMNHDGDLDEMLGFFQAESAFYPDLDRLYRQRVREAYRAANE